MGLCNDLQLQKTSTFTKMSQAKYTLTEAGENYNLPP